MMEEGNVEQDQDAKHLILLIPLQFLKIAEAHRKPETGLVQKRVIPSTSPLN